MNTDTAVQSPAAASGGAQYEGDVMRIPVMVLVLAALALGGCTRQPPVAPVETPKETVQPAPDSAAAEPVDTTPATPALSMPPPGEREPSLFPAYLALLQQKALAQGISQDTVERAFADVHLVSPSMQEEHNPQEDRLTLDEYLQQALPVWKIRQGRRMYQYYQPQLTAVTERFGIPERYLVALWGLESNFGKLQGNEDVISVLASLAFTGEREAFFTEQLMAALQILQQGEIPRDKLRGAWTGAMGQAQFMPTTYLTYGVGSRGDGHGDIWSNVDDVFASIANYLSRTGWQPGVGWGREVQLPAEFSADWAGTEDAQARTLADWQQVGVRGLNGQALPESRQKAWIVTLDQQPVRAFLVYDNFRTLMRWNPSYRFAISVGMMADSLAPSYKRK